MPAVRLRALVPAVVAALVTPLLITAPAGAVTGSDGIGDAYYPLDGNGGIDVTSYAIHDRYRFGQAKITGSTTLHVTATEDLDQFDLDLLLNATAVKVDGVTAAFSKPSQHELQITPNTPIPSGSHFVVTVSYAGHPGRYSYEGESNWLANRQEVVAMNQPHMAPWWFPSNDHPSDKALMDISITVPRHQQVIANGNRIGRQRHGSLATTHWRADEPMATYLAFFAAGHYAVREGVDHGLPYYAAVNKRVDQPQRKELLDLLSSAPDVVHQLSKDLGPYPFDTTGGLVTALPVYFALENQTRPTYPTFSPSGEYLIVHELAHQWFGDSVALQRWSDIWLNEGSATFMEKRWAELHGGPSADTWLRNTYDSVGSTAHFWDLTIGDPGPSHIFDDAVYDRGGMTLQALRNRLRDPVFWNVIQSWLSKDRQSGNTTQDFEALAEQVSGEDLSGFFDAWLFTAAKPDDTVANGLG